MSLDNAAITVLDLVLSAQPTVGRFALGPPLNVQSLTGIWSVPFRKDRIRSRLGLDYARDDGAKYRSAWLDGGTRASRPTEAMYVVKSGIL